MQAITTETDFAPMVTASAEPRAAITFEVIAYAVLMVLVLVLRLAELDTVPLSDGEARQALAAWRVVYPEAPGSEIVPESPLLFLLQSLSFSVFGTSEGSVRWATALVGVFLVFSPLLFRDALGRGRTFVFVLLLVFSPVFLLASRFNTSSVWSLAFAVLCLWSLRRYWLTQNAGYGVLGAMFFAAMTLLTGPGGLTFGMVLLLAGVLSLLWTRLEEPDSDWISTVRAQLDAFPWQRALVASALTVLAVSTILGLYLPGLSAVSEGLFVSLRAPLSANANTPAFYPLIVSLFYEPITWVFGLAAIILLTRRGTFTLLERFLIVWLVGAVAAGLLYDRAEYALWIITPLIGLALSVVVSVLSRERHPFYNTPAWGKPVLALCVVALLAMFTTHFQIIVRTFTSIPGGVFTQITFDTYNGLWALIALALIVVGYFLVSGLWGQTAALRSVALGLLVFGLITSLGAGWNAAVPNASNATELWHTQATGQEVFLLRDLLMELSRRETGGVPRVPVTVLAPDDGIAAWILRDFTNTTYIVDVGEARAQEIILLPKSPQPPDLRGSYVGQDFVMTRTWSPQTLLGLDFFAWWTQRRTRVEQTPTDVMVLWLRQDIYDGVPFEAIAPVE
jgi:hypothetical protein